MSQATPIIGANQPGLDYRNQDNDGKQALLNHHKGSTEPSYKEAGIIWLDDGATPWVVKMYDGAAWIVMGLMDATTDTFEPYFGTGVLPFRPYAADTGSANAYAIAPAPAIASYTTGQTFLLKPANASTGSSTLAVNGLAAKTIKTWYGTNVDAGSLLTTGVYYLMYDGTNMVLLNCPTYVQGANVASASTIDLGSATGDYVHVTGTTTITGITLAKGRECTVVFDGILTLTNGASLILDGAANIATIAGDKAIFRGEASGVVRMVAYIRAGGTPGLKTVNQWAGAQRAGTTTLTSSSASIAVDMALNNDFKHTFTENTTLANPSNAVEGQSGAIRFTQHASSPKTLDFGTSWKFPGGTEPSASATNSAADTLYYYVRSSTFIECNYTKGFA